jgi:hypothetical protein
MAKAVLELAVNTGKWDAGIKKAQTSLNNFIDANGGLQKTLQKDSSSVVQAFRVWRRSSCGSGSRSAA